MSVDLATLGLEVRSDSAVTARDRLRQLPGAARQAETATARMGRQVVVADRQLAGLGATAMRTHTFLTRTFGVLGIGIGLSRLPGAISRVVEQADNLAKSADRIGLATGALQELRHAGELAGVATQSLDRNMEAFSRRVGDAINGSGQLAEVLKLNRVALRDVDGNIRPVNDLLGDMAGLIQRATSDQERLSLAQLAFGREGRSMVNMLRDGAAGLEAARREARDLGLVLEDDLLRQAEDVNDDFTRLGTTFRVRFQRDVLTAVGAVRTLREEMSLTGGVAQSLGDFLVNTFGHLATAEERATGALQGLLAAGPRPFDMTPFHALRGAQGPATVVPTILGEDGDGAGRGRAGAISAAEREAEAIRQVVQELEFEHRMLGMTGAAREVALALQRAGIDEHHAEAGAVRLAAERYFELSETISAAERRQQEFERGMEDLGRTGVGALSALAFHGEKFSDVLRRLTVRLGEAALEASILGTGPLARLFGGGGGLIGSIAGGSSAPLPPGSGGLYASGGTLAAGQWGIVGERGPEPVFARPGGGATILPNRRMGDAGGGVSVRFEVVDRAGVQFEAGQPRDDGNGEVVIPLLIRELEGTIAASVHEGPVGRAIEQRFGTHRVTR